MKERDRERHTHTKLEKNRQTDKQTSREAKL